MFAPISWTSARTAAVGVIAGLALMVPAIGAQTPEASPAATGDAHPVHIHAGACPEPGDVVVPLPDLTIATGEATGPETAGGVHSSWAVVDIPLQDIIDGGHAINAHASADDMGTYIACGDIGGVIVDYDDGEQELLIRLDEQNDSGYVGMAWLGSSEDGATTEVSVVLISIDGED